MQQTRIIKDSASFRDPSGFVFSRNSIIYRQVNYSYQENYNFFLSSGLYQALIKHKYLTPHREVSLNTAASSPAYKVLQPQVIPFISYPYEWCFSQLKNAALLTLEIQKTALNFGMSLKDASAYNVQFIGSRPVLIDELSFEKYRTGKPWVAYRQFCQHFLAPLSLMAYKDMRLNVLLSDFIDGIPLPLASSLLPLSSRMNLGLFGHLHLHARSQKHFAARASDTTKYSLNRTALVSLIENLSRTIQTLKPSRSPTEWSDYYTHTNYSNPSFLAKKSMVKSYFLRTRARSIIDLGSNTGEFSRLVTKVPSYCLSVDSDPLAVETNYQSLEQDNIQGILPLVIDLINPSPAIGWANKERRSFSQRVSADTVLALALVHHLAISNNLPLPSIAEYLADMGRFLIIEFIPKRDSQVQKLLSAREDIFPNYHQIGFETAFSRSYRIIRRQKISRSDRYLYLMHRK